jgi:hypothetical protein
MSPVNIVVAKSILIRICDRCGLRDNHVSRILLSLRSKRKEEVKGKERKNQLHYYKQVMVMKISLIDIPCSQGIALEARSHGNQLIARR